MARRLVLAKPFGIPVHVDVSWFILLALVSWTLATGYFPDYLRGASAMTYGFMGLGAALLLFVCVWLHEMGHALAAKRYGIPVGQITLFIFGGVAQITGQPVRPRIELAIAVAGPVVSLLLAAICFVTARAFPRDTAAQLIGVAILQYLALVNLALMTFNLLPGFPLDGGRILRALLWAGSGSLSRATGIAATLGTALGLGLFAMGLVSLLRGHVVGGIWYCLLGHFLRDAARANARDMRLTNQPGGS